MKKPNQKKGQKKSVGKVAVLLHDIRSVHNVGSIFRTADALGITNIYMSGYTPTPLDRFGRERKDFSKVALGAEKTISWEFLDNPEALISTLKKEGFRVVGVEQTPDAVDYKTVHSTGDTLFIVGNEVEGISERLLSLCDVVVEIPMRGKKESLNVSVAFGVALYRILEV